jgi:hypothetical protein
VTGCRATMRVGCPDTPATLVCHRLSHEPVPGEPASDHYDAAEQAWWRPNTGDEPELYRHAPPSRPSLRDTGD